MAAATDVPMPPCAGFAPPMPMRQGSGFFESGERATTEVRKLKPTPTAELDVMNEFASKSSDSPTIGTNSGGHSKPPVEPSFSAMPPEPARVQTKYPSRREDDKTPKLPKASSMVLYRRRRVYPPSMGKCRRDPSPQRSASFQKQRALSSYEY
jgi:hypothetical protein